LVPLQSVHPDAARTRRALALPRFLTPAALPTHRDPPIPGFAYLGHVASLHLPCASTLYSLGELPGVLSTRCALGVKALQSLTRQRSSRSLDVTSPLAISILAAFQSDIKPTAFVPPRNWPSAGMTPRTSRSWSLSDHRYLPRFWRMRHCCTQRLRFRGLIPLPVGVSVDRFLDFPAPWLS